MGKRRAARLRPAARLVAHALALGLCLAVGSTPARAAEGSAAAPVACPKAYENAQEQREAGKLRLARESLLACAQPSCKAFIRADCERWLGEVNASLPSVVVSAQDASGNDLTDVSVSVDGVMLSERLDGRAIAVDPGPHTFRFERAGQPPVEQAVVVREGEKNRVIEVRIVAARPAPVSSGAPVASAAPPLPQDADAGPPTLAWVLGGVGVVALGAFTVFALGGKGKESDLQGTCAPRCSDDELSPIRRDYLIADLSLGVGVISLGIATYLLLQPSSSPAATADHALKVDVRLGQRGGYAGVVGSF